MISCHAHTSGVAMSAATNIRILENCINRALFRIFGSSCKSSSDYIKICTGLHNIKGLVEKRHCSFIDKLISDVRFSNLLFTARCYASAVLAMALCLSVCLSVRLSVRHKSVFY